MKTFIANKNDQGRTILKFLEKVLNDVPKSKLEKLFRNKDIKINGARTKDKTIKINESDEIIIYGVESNGSLQKFKPTNINFNLVYEDKNIVVVSKKEGVVMSSQKDSLDNQILSYLKFKQEGSFVPSSIGRLDKVTSGIVVYAKNYLALKTLKEKQSNFEKIYIFKSDLNKSVETNYKIDHDEERRREVCGTVGKPTKTIFKANGIIKKAILVTGRKHQIRASLSKLGFPIYGDRRYGGKPARRVFLHSYSLKFAGLDGEFKYLNTLEIVDKPKW